MWNITIQRLRFWVLLPLSLLSFGCDNGPDQWDAFKYPNENDLTVIETIRGFKTFELCQQAAIDQLRSLPDPDSGDYECGYKCGPSAKYGGLNVCKKPGNDILSAKGRGQ